MLIYDLSFQLQAKMAAVQQQLQDLKARLDTEDTERYSDEEQALVDRVEQLKEEFRELLTELRRKRIAQGSSVHSDVVSRPTSQVNFHRRDYRDTIMFTLNYGLLILSRQILLS